jgi:hypothetical protein
MTSGTFRPERPVSRGFDLVRLEICDLAVDERLGDGRPERQELRVGDDGAAAEVVEMAEAEFQIVPERLCVHSFEVMDNFQYANPAMPRDEGFEFLRRAIELLGRDPLRNLDLDRGEVVPL